MYLLLSPYHFLTYSLYWSFSQIFPRFFILQDNMWRDLNITKKCEKFILGFFCFTKAFAFASPMSSNI